MPDQQGPDNARIEHFESELKKRDEVILSLNMQLLALKQIAATTFPAGSPLLTAGQKYVMVEIRRELGMERRG
jgi:hypothetical protein